MFIASCDVGYDARAALEKMTAEHYQEIREAVPTLELPKDQEGLSGWYNYHDKVLTEEEIALLVQLEFPVTVKKMRGLRYGVDSWHPRKGGPQGEVTYNISVAGVGIMQIQNVDYLENACTDEVQRMLNDGWRILAVCPPNDTRRPTYILGHTDKAD